MRKLQLLPGIEPHPQREMMYYYCTWDEESSLLLATQPHGAIPKATTFRLD